MKYIGEGKYIRKTGGNGSHGHCVIELSPKERGTGNEIMNSISNGEIPKEYFKSIQNGLEQALEEGFLSGYPIVDVLINVIGGSYHDVDSKPDDFKQAAKLAVKDACSKAPMTLLEPIAMVEVDTPEEYIGAIVGDLTKRRGVIQDVSPTIKALVPSSELFGYATDLRSLTQGRASFNTTPNNYEEVPQNLLATIIS
jgi:elongation factor G